MRIPELTCAALAVALAYFQPVRSQQLSADEKNAAIQTIAKHIAANYIHPEQGGQIASHIQMANFNGLFQKANSWNEFDEMVTNELRKFSGDGHLYVKHDPAKVKELNDPPAAGNVGNVNGAPSAQPAVNESRVLDGNVGYLKFSEININKNNVEDVYAAMKKMDGTKALIIDLRDNGGGGSEVGPVLESFFLPAGKPTLRFTQRDGNFTTDSTMSLKQAGYDNPVYVLINHNTASAAEAFAFVLQQNRRARIVGERSAGAAYMNSWFVVNDENYVSVSTAAPSVPGKNISWEKEGIQPDIRLKKGDALDVALREALKN